MFEETDSDAFALDGGVVGRLEGDGKAKNPGEEVEGVLQADDVDKGRNLDEVRHADSPLRGPYHGGYGRRLWGCTS
jgi:hypothetical protein